jgi:hypothetical protein
MKDWIKKNGFVFSLLTIGGLGLIAIGSHVIWLFVEGKSILNELGQKDTPLYLVNIAIALAAIATAIFTWWKNVINNKQAQASQDQNDLQQKQFEAQQKQIDAQKEQADRQIEIQNDTRLDSLYAKAIEFLKQENDLITRKGGVHILKDLAVTSQKHTQKCIDMLCSLNEVWMPDILSEKPDFFLRDTQFNWMKEKITDNKLLHEFEIKSKYTGVKKQDWLAEEISLSQDINKHLASIISFICKNEDIKDIYDFSNKYLCSINLSNINLKKIRLDDSCLIGANIHKCTFEGYINRMKLDNCNIRNCNFSDITLNKVSFDNATLPNCNFNETTLYSISFIRSNMHFLKAINSKLYNCIFDGAKLEFVNFQLADLHECTFVGSNLKDAQFDAAILDSLDFTGADLSRAKFQGSKIKYTEFKAANLLPPPTLPYLDFLKHYA